jgi:hypothetical protein
MSSSNRRPAADEPPDNRVRKAPIRPLKSPSLFLRLWLSCPAQYVFLIVFAAALGCTYYLAHRRMNDRYWGSTGNIVRSSLGTYQLGLDATGQRVELQYAGQPVTDVSRLPPAPFGIEKIASIQSVLSRYVALAQSANLAYQQNQSALLSAFTPTDQGDFALRLSWFPQAGDATAEFRLSAATLATFRTLRGPALQQAVAARLRSSRVFDPAQGIEIAALNTPARAEDSADSTAEPSKPETTLSEVRAYLRMRIADAVAAGDQERRELNEAFQPGSFRALTAEENQAVATYFSSWDERVLRLLPASGTPAGVTPPSHGTLEGFFQKASAQMCDELIEVVRAETSSFWLMGRWRWLEMIWWVWFGILTQALVQHGLHLVGVLRGEIWQPGELLRTLAKFFYAPLLTIGLFFLAEYIGSTREAVEFSRNSPVTLGICLIMGLFPNTAYRIIKEITTTVFRTTLTTSGSARAAPATTAVNLDVTHKAAGGVYTRERLKQNISALVTAPLQTEKK